MNASFAFISAKQPSKRLPLQRADSLVPGLGDFFLTREMMVYYARTRSRALCNKRHWSFMKASLRHNAERRALFILPCLYQAEIQIPEAYSIECMCG
jgi:hypothetical protein